MKTLQRSLSSHLSRYAKILLMTKGINCKPVKPQNASAILIEALFRLLTEFSMARKPEVYNVIQVLSVMQLSKAL